MQLHHIEAAGIRNAAHPIHAFIHEYANSFHKRWKLRNYGLNRLHTNKPGAFPEENKTQSVGPGVDRLPGIFQVGGAAYFYFDHSRLNFYHLRFSGGVCPAILSAYLEYPAKS